MSDDDGVTSQLRGSYRATSQHAFEALSFFFIWLRPRSAAHEMERNASCEASWLPGQDPRNSESDDTAGSGGEQRAISSSR